MAEVIYELDVVKIKREAVNVIREAIKGGYYSSSSSDKEKMKRLNEINKEICRIYGVREPKSILVGLRVNSYYPGTETIYLENYSLISYLHEVRHHMQKVKGCRYRGLTIEQDSRAFSMRLFYLAVPKMFLKAVKENRVSHISFDNLIGQVVDSATYI